jgi:hypothetical protein
MASKRTTIINYVRDTTLAAITVAGGYNNTLTSRHRGLRPMDAEADSKFPIVFLPKADEDMSNITHKDVSATMRLRLVGYVKNSDGLDGLQQDLDGLIQDVRKALEQDRLLGGNCYSLRILNVTTDDGDLDPIAGFGMEVEIKYAYDGVLP